MDKETWNSLCWWLIGGLCGMINFIVHTSPTIQTQRWTFDAWQKPWGDQPLEFLGCWGLHVCAHVLSTLSHVSLGGKNFKDLFAFFFFLFDRKMDHARTPSNLWFHTYMQGEQVAHTTHDEDWTRSNCSHHWSCIWNWYVQFFLYLANLYLESSHWEMMVTCKPRGSSFKLCKFLRKPVLYHHHIFLRN